MKKYVQKGAHFRVFFGQQFGGDGRKTPNFMRKTDFALISTIFIRWGSFFA
jgi:hypothetical protein